jgi:hypothetical protein
MRSSCDPRSLCGMLTDAALRVSTTRAQAAVGTKGPRHLAGPVAC